MPLGTTPRRLSRPLLVAVVAMTVVACAGRGEEEPTQSERLAMPPDLSDQRVGQVPERRQATADPEADAERERAEREVAPEPPGLRVRHQGADRWLEIALPPDASWEAVRDWLETMNIPIAREDAERGIIETKWLARPLGPAGGAFLALEGGDGPTPLVDQYHLRVESTDEPERTELFVSHRRVAGVNDDGWEPQRAERALEAEVLRAFMLHLGSDEEFVARQLAVEEEELVSLRTAEDGEPELLIRESYLGAWRRIGLALDRAAFSVEERDRAQGIYVVRYDPGADQEDGPGFFGRLAFWREREPELEPGLYAIAVRSSDDGAVARVRTEEGEPVPEQLSERLLSLIGDQIR